MNLLKIMDLLPQERGEDEWFRLGECHGHACIARLFKSQPLPVYDHDDYIQCVIAGLTVELAECDSIYEAGYFHGYLSVLNGYESPQLEAA